MPRKVIRKDGALDYVEFTVDEFAAYLRDHLRVNVDREQLESWGKAIPAQMVDGQRVYTLHSQAERDTIRKRALILRTGMSQKALENIEREGVLDAYASLAEDCPDGLTAHVWRSYGLVVLMQLRHGVKIDAEELARRARLAERDPQSGKTVLGVEMAKKHLRLLQALGYLKSVEAGERDSAGKAIEEARWETPRAGLPEAWARLAG